MLTEKETLQIQALLMEQTYRLNDEAKKTTKGDEDRWDTKLFSVCDIIKVLLNWTNYKGDVQQAVKDIMLQWRGE